MPLQSAFTLSAVQPESDNYDPSAPDAPTVFAELRANGAANGPAPNWRMADQVANDEVIIGNSAADPSDQSDITNFWDQMYNHSSLTIRVFPYNLRDDHQLLLVFGFKRRDVPELSSVQFFVGAGWVATESIDDDFETIALLLDGPFGSSVSVSARLASQWGRSGVGFRGLEGFII